jgi:Cu/Zn superoxide dismutase
LKITNLRRRSLLKRLFPFLILVLLVVFCAPAYAAQAEQYSATFKGINGSGVSGKGSLTFDGDELKANIQASGLEANQFHGMHIHGIEGQDLKCPSDSNNSGYMSHDEVHMAFGGHAFDFTPYPTADANGNISFDRSYTENLDKLAPLDEKVIVIHGATVDGQYDGDVAVGCAEIEPANTLTSSLPGSGGVGTILLFGAAILIAGLALVAVVFLVHRRSYVNRG